MRLKGRYVADPVISIDRGEGVTELITESEAEKIIQYFDINPHKKYTAEERERMKKRNSILTGVAIIPSAICLMVSVGYTAYRFEMFVPIALACFSVTAFILIANSTETKKGK